jgi:hypothetical protein
VLKILNGVAILPVEVAVNIEQGGHRAELWLWSVLLLLIIGLRCTNSVRLNCTAWFLSKGDGQRDYRLEDVNLHQIRSSHLLQLGLCYNASGMRSSIHKF